MGFSSPQWQLFEFCDEMPVLVRGSSMLPWLRSGDLIHLDTRRDPSIGDIVLCRRDDCPPLLHRVVDQRDDRWLTRGDNVPGDDGWCLRGQIVGVAIAGERRCYQLCLTLRLTTKAGISGARCVRTRGSQWTTTWVGPLMSSS